MGLMNVFNQIRASRYENLYSSMDSKEKCKDCDGLGFSFPNNEFVMIDKCSNCDGSGFVS